MKQKSKDTLDNRLAKAIADYWKTRRIQAAKQNMSNKKDQGARKAVTGGAQMNGFIKLITQIIIEKGVAESNIFYNSSLELPGYFRPTKKWDLLVVKDKQLVLALELKSQVGPSFGNNFNNRTEEAMGSALDLWTAFREGAFNETIQPWLGYLFLLEDCPESRKSVKVEEPHFKVLKEFRDASYARRYELFCRKLVRERQYNAAAFLISERTKGEKGNYSQPAKDLTFEIFINSIVSQVNSFGKSN